jgi:hypothetical protein
LLTLAAVALDKPHRVPLDVLRWVVGPPVSAVACDFVFEPGPEHFGPDAHAFFVWSPVVWNVRARFSLSFFFFPLFGGVRDTSRDRPETVPGHIGTRCSALPLRIFCSPRTLAVALISRRRGLERPLRFGWQWRLAGCRRPNADRDQDNVHDIADLRSERHRSAFKRVRQKSQVGTGGGSAGRARHRAGAGVSRHQVCPFLCRNFPGHSTDTTEVPRGNPTGTGRSQEPLCPFLCRACARSVSGFPLCPGCPRGREVFVFWPFLVAGAPGFEPGNGGIKIRLEIPVFRPSFRKIAPKPSTKYQ